jgi:glycosyltransferase involved in cell wall biosynthesis
MATSVLEAMSYGLPVITRPVGGIADFFQDGTMGFLTESCDPAVLAALTERLIVDPTLRLHIGAFNRRYAREHFAASVVAQRIQRIYLAVGGSRVD